MARLLEAGRNAWRVERARRAAFLIDADDYFAALAAAVRAARHAVHIAGWEIDDRTRLGPREAGDGDPGPELGSLLTGALERRRGLRVRVLGWDFAMIYTFERGLMPLFRLRFTQHRRLQFRLDGVHPVGASHHQKLVVVDDALAFVGGIDLTERRWDTSEHAAEDPRRRTSDGDPYPPFHDVQAVVEGPAAGAVGELFRERWRWATGRSLQPVGASGEVWPDPLRPWAEDVAVGVARTLPAHRERREVREVERLYLDAIASAERYLYFENQYLTSAAITGALVERLGQERGPDVVIVLPRSCPGWLEQRTVGLLREKRLRALREADRHGRLGVYCPQIAAPGEEAVYVHAKVMVSDDRIARVGSANLSNRSMGFDTECDLALAADGDLPLPAARSLLDRLLGEHLSRSEEEVRAAVEREGSPLRAVETLRRSGTRTLVELEPGRLEPELEGALELSSALADPETPGDPESLVASFIADDVPRAARSPWLRAAVLAALMIALAAAWRYTPLSEHVTLPRLRDAAAALRGPAAPLLVAAGYAAASLLLVPVTLLIVATAIAFDPLRTVVYAVIGVTSASAAGFGLGRVLGRDLLRHLGGRRLNELSRRVSRRGAAAVAAVRLVPVAPFAVVNLIAGATHLRLRDFLLGTLAGTAPGIVAIALLETGVESVVAQPTPGRIALLALLTAAAVGGFALVRRLIRSRDA